MGKRWLHSYSLSSCFMFHNRDAEIHSRWAIKAFWVAAERWEFAEPWLLRSFSNPVKKPLVSFPLDSVVWYSMVTKPNTELLFPVTLQDFPAGCGVARSLFITALSQFDDWDGVSVNCLHQRSQYPLLHQGNLRAGLETVRNLEPVLRILTSQELALSQENWFKCRNNTYLQPRTANIKYWGGIIVTNKTN